MKKTMLAALCLFAAAQPAHAQNTPPAKPERCKIVAKEYASKFHVYFEQYRRVESELGV